MAFNLVSALMQDMEEEQVKSEQTVKEHKAELDDIYNQALTASTETKYSATGISPTELVSYVQSKVAELSPICTSIILRPIEYIKRNVIMYTDGAKFYIGTRFFEENVDVLILTMLKLCTGILLGHYVAPRDDKESTEYRIIHKYLMREVYTRILNTLILTKPYKLGIRIALGGFSQTTLDTFLTPNLTYTSLVCEHITNKMVVDVTASATASYLKAKKTDLSKRTVLVVLKGVNLEIQIPSDITERYTTYKAYKEKEKLILSEKQDLLKKLNSVKKSNPTPKKESSPQNDVSAEPSNIEALSKEQVEPSNTEVLSEEQVEPSNTEVLLEGQAVINDSNYDEVDSQPDSAMVQGFEQLPTAEDNSDNFIREVCERVCQDDLKEVNSYSVEQIQKLLDDITDHMTSFTNKMIDAKLEEVDAMTLSDIFNQLRELVKETNGSILQDLAPAIGYACSINDMEQHKEALMHRLELEYIENLYQLTDEQLKRLIQRLGSELPKLVVTEWNKQIRENNLPTYIHVVDYFIHNMYDTLEDEVQEVFIKTLESFMPGAFMVEEEEDTRAEEEENICTGEEEEHSSLGMNNLEGAFSEFEDEEPQQEDLGGSLDEPLEVPQADLEYKQEEQLCEEKDGDLTPSEDYQILTGNGDPTEPPTEISTPTEAVSSTEEPLDASVEDMGEFIDTVVQELEDINQVLQDVADQIMADLAPTDSEGIMGEFDDMDFDMSESEYRMLTNNALNLCNIYGDSDLSTFINRNIEAMFKVTVSWYTLLEKMVKKFLPSRISSFCTPDKRYTYMNIILPGRGSKSYKNCIERISLYLDSSSSMMPKDLSITKSMVQDLSKKLPKKTEAYEFNGTLSKLKVVNGRLVENPHRSGCTNISAVLNNIKPKDSGKVMSIIISDGGFDWVELKEFLSKRPKEKMAVVLTRDIETYSAQIESNLGISRSRFLIIPITDSDIREKVKGFE